jgi:hypothetical protein
MLETIKTELERLHADGVEVSEEQETGQLRVTLRNRSCTVMGTGLLEMLRGLPEGAGSSAIENAFETHSESAEPWLIQKS